MSNIQVRNTQSVDATAGKSKKPTFLRLEKQVIRTLTGAELSLVGGGMSCCCGSCSCHTSPPGEKL